MKNLPLLLGALLLAAGACSEPSSITETGFLDPGDFRQFVEVHRPCEQVDHEGLSCTYGYDPQGRLIDYECPGVMHYRFDFDLDTNTRTATYEHLHPEVPSYEVRDVYDVVEGSILHIDSTTTYSDGTMQRKRSDYVKDELGRTVQVDQVALPGGESTGHRVMTYDADSGFIASQDSELLLDEGDRITFESAYLAWTVAGSPTEWTENIVSTVSGTSETTRHRVTFDDSGRQVRHEWDQDDDGSIDGSSTEVYDCP